MFFCMNNLTSTTALYLALKPSHDEVLLSSTHCLLSLEVSKFPSTEPSRSTALLEEHSSLGSSVGREATTALLLHSSLGSSVCLDTREHSSRGEVTPDDCLLGTDHVSSPGNIRNSQEPCSGVTVGIVRTGSCCEACGELGGTKCGGGKGKHKEKHLDIFDMCVLL